jgi:hypothetical protein
MKLNTANKVRAKIIEAIMAYFVEADEDCGMIASNSFNFPICEDGEEGWVEIVVKIPKDSDDGDDGYAKREEYGLKCAEKAEKEKAKAEAKAKKIARDKAMREAKAKDKAEG